MAGRRKGWCDLSMPVSPRIGFMQGRLSPQVDGRIQAFPWATWRQEFSLAASIGLSVMEWTLDAARLEENPLMTRPGRSEIRELAGRYSILIPSVTGDCFMQEPFWKVVGDQSKSRLAMLEQVVEASREAGVGLVVVPLVDNGAIADPKEEERFRNGIDQLIPLLQSSKIMLAIESDLPPDAQVRLVSSFPKECVAINFDMGNSASLGWSPEKELRTVGARIGNVHVKDRLRGGGTVPLGQGAVEFPAVFRELDAAGYRGRVIIQAARALDGDHVGLLRTYAGFVETFLGKKR